MPPDGSIAYLYALTQFERLRNLPKADFDREIDKLTAQEVAATGEAYLDKVRQYHRLFMLPAMGHCAQPAAAPTAIGGGANEPPDAYRNADHHAVSAAIKWVEQGVAPGEDRRIPGWPGWQGRAAASGVRLSCGSEVQGSGRRQRRRELQLRDAQRIGSSAGGQRHDADPELASATGRQAAEPLDGHVARRCSLHERPQRIEHRIGLLGHHRVAGARERDHARLAQRRRSAPARSSRAP